ncbi:hypothetical protein F0562_028632 [Nyssa sinensis]|uniref:Zinc-finger domain-containing protein n=1 Tax=Nyssa sinensis TaxID=561372 RepID=A0A5J5B0L9_9ASTE|nr:hypothetical protein F0562_028632 [Nyssa sinensis]
MVATRKKAQNQKITTNTEKETQNEGKNDEVSAEKETKNEAQNGEVSGYEQLRGQRIKENMLRMQKLGILDLSRKLKSDFAPPKRTTRNPSDKKSALSLSEPFRRSSRLKSITPVNYTEIRAPKKRTSAEYEDGEIQIPEGSKPEIYTEDHAKLLGDCKTSWTLYVDGFDENRDRIYDPINGKSCHQCRQKTLGHRTHCSKCNMVSGQFCGDCLYMRYGENVMEANENSNWICPVCRGICNCSRCRKAKGWAPTGSIYRKVTGLGFKSVAHYLIQARQSPHLDNCPDGIPKPESEDNKDDEMEEEEKEDVVIAAFDS